VVKDVTNSPHIMPNYGDMGDKNTVHQAKSKAPITLPQMNGILDELGLGTLGGKTEKFVMKGSGEGAPRSDGQVGKRSDAVKQFLNDAGDKLGGFFAKIGKGFQTAFEGIKGVVTSAVTTIKEAFTASAESKGRPESPELRERKNAVLKEFGEDFSKAMELEYSNYKTSTQDDPPKTRSEFLRNMMPAPEGGIDRNALGFIGDRLDFLGKAMAPTKDENLQEMRQAMMQFFAETPSLEVTQGKLFQAECTAFDSNPATFLRGNSAFTKLDKFMGLTAMPLTSLAEGVLTGQKENIDQFGHLGMVNDQRMGMKSLTQEQAAAVLEVGSNILNELLDVDPNKPDSFANSIDQSYRDQLSAQAQQIVDNGNLSADEKKSAMNMMYANSLFLRAMSPEMINVGIKAYGGGDSQTFVVQTLQFLQTFLNGAADSFGDKANDTAVGIMNQLSQAQQPRLEAFFQALGMPVLDPQVN
jgi:hypothetical protein